MDAIERLMGIRFDAPGVTFMVIGEFYSWWTVTPYVYVTCSRASDALDSLTDYYLRTRAQSNAA